MKKQQGERSFNECHTRRSINQYISGCWVGGGGVGYVLTPHQDLRTRAHGFFFFGNNTDVEDGREDENEARSRSGT